MELPAPCSQHVPLSSGSTQSRQGGGEGITYLLVQGDKIQTHAHLASEEVGSIGTMAQEAPAKW